VLTKCTFPSVLSRLKVAHSKLKRFLIVSNGGLFNIVRNIKTLIRNDINNYTITITRQKDHVPYNVREPEFKDILTKVTPLYLRYLKDQLQFIKADNY
jgi:hypothetical protein